MLEKDYEPEDLQFVLPDAVRETFPTELDFEGCEDDKAIIEKVNERFNAVFPENEEATRYMDDAEKDDIRMTYCKLVETNLPEAEADLLDAKETAKRIKDNAEGRYNAVRKQISDFAAKVKEGTKQKVLPSTKTFKIALNGYFLYYAVLKGKAVLAKAEKISSYDKSSLWANEDKNRVAMMELFGIEYPEVDKPTDEEFDEENDMLPDDDVMDEEDFDSATDE